MEQDNGDDKNTVNEVCGGHANFWYMTAHQKWWKKNRIGLKLWSGVKKVFGWAGR